MLMMMTMIIWRKTLVEKSTKTPRVCILDRVHYTGGLDAFDRHGLTRKRVINHLASLNTIEISKGITP